MIGVILDPAPLEEIRAHGERTYPEECCGFLLAAREDAAENRHVLRVIPSENRVPGMRNRRFVILPEEVARVEQEAERSGELLVGFYHSHPDHPAEPSRFDEEHAWPWYTYIVLRVANGRASELGAYALDAETRRFGPVHLSLPSSASGFQPVSYAGGTQTPSA